MSSQESTLERLKAILGGEPTSRAASDSEDGTDEIEVVGEWKNIPTATNGVNNGSSEGVSNAFQGLPVLDDKRIARALKARRHTVGGAERICM